MTDMAIPDADRAMDPRSAIPLTDAVFHILLVLAEGPRHGYGIMREVERMTKGELTIGHGTLYRSLQGMVADELVAELREAGDAPAGDGRRRTYQLTPFGMAVARAEARRLSSLVETARTRGLLTRPWVGKPREES